MVDNKIIKIEDKWQNLWKKNKVFEPKIDISKKKYFGNVAYPYANSVLHIGHGRTYTNADIFLRYQRVLGKNVLYPMGFHISGTPVLAVADGIKRGDKKVIKQVKTAISDYIIDEKQQDKLIETFKEPSNIADFFSNTIEGSFESIGISNDWTRQFTTGEPIYNKFVEWQFSKLKSAGLLKQGKYPILYSPLDENAVGEDDIKDGDLEKVSISNMVGIKFKIVNKNNAINEFVICATLRPDALFCVTNLWVKPEMDLVKLKVGNEIWIVSKMAQVKVEHQFDNVKFISDLKGSDLLKNKVVAPIINKEIPIYSANFCDENHGTGIVYSSPADSPHDYLNLFMTKFPGKKLNDFLDEEPLKLIPITETFNNKGKKIEYKFNIPAYDILIKNKIYIEKGNEEKLEIVKQKLYKEAHFGAKMINSGEFDGLPLKKNIGADKVRDKLFELNLGVYFYETSRRAKSRNNDDIIVANLQGQWFLDYSDQEVKNKALKLLDKADFYPKNLKQTEIGYINWANLRPCARKRGLGTKIPYDKDWIIEPLSDSTIYQMLYLISHLIRKYNVEPIDLTFEVFDYLYLDYEKPKSDFKTLNFNNFLEEAKTEIDYWNAVDFRGVGMPHMSNHLNFLIYHYSLIFPESKWPKMIVAANLMMRDGEKISKSKGNGIPLFQMKQIYGADLYRLYIGVNSNFDVEMDFKDEEIYNLNKKYLKWIEFMEGSIKYNKLKFDEYSEIDKWLISKFYSSVKKYFENMNEFKIREAYVEILYDVLNNINYHLRRTNLKQTLKVIRFFIEDYLILMTPIIPHICEELNQKIFGENSEFISLKAYTTNENNFIDNEVLNKEEIIFDLIKKISKQIENYDGIINIISIYQSSSDKFNLYDELSELLKNGKNPKEIFGILNSKFSSQNKFIKKFVPKCFGEGISYYLSKNLEKKLLEQNLVFLEKEFKCKFEILDNDLVEDKVNCSPRDFGIKIK